ncbi:hypothetical protein EDB84DRAFT_1531163 [Lactarius hengduanensis]|nr:hypothetical protein EDB84DRAFT_1531163 [Lactarius hengduanensis]
MTCRTPGRSRRASVLLQISSKISSSDPTQPLDKEDTAVGSHDLISGRDNIAAESAFPHDANKWVLVPMRRDSVASSPSAPGPTHAFLPKDRDMVQHIVHIYFERLNFHRPVFSRHEIEVICSTLQASCAPSISYFPSVPFPSSTTARMDSIEKLKTRPRALASSLGSTTIRPPKPSSTGQSASFASASGELCSCTTAARPFYSDARLLLPQTTRTSPIQCGPSPRGPT